MYETFKLDYPKYYSSGHETANWLMALYEKHTGRKPISVLDWGCGPGRVVRHIPQVLSSASLIYGADFNSQTIAWCRKHIPDVTFVKNNLDPPINMDNSRCQLIYAISVFTHLSAPRHTLWLKELYRILEPAGILIFTSQGVIFKKILSTNELRRFDRGEIIIRETNEEGRRTFSTFHPPSYIRSLLKDFDLLEFIEGGDKDGQLEQDVWIVQKK